MAVQSARRSVRLPAVRAQQARDAALRYVGVLGALALLIVWFSVTQEDFASSENLLNILRTNAALLVVAVGMTLVMLVGGFDLSVGGMLALSGVMLAMLIEGGLPSSVAILLVIAGAIGVGLCTNGLLIGALGLSFFVVTIGTASLFRGVAFVTTEGRTQGVYDDQLIRTLGSGEVAGIPWAVVIALVVLVVAWVVLRLSGYGHMIYAVGGNAEASRLAGIKVRAIRMSVYAIAAGLAAVAAVLTTGRLSSASPDMGLGIELTAGAAVLVGGTSFLGGSGGLTGTLLGVLFLGVLANGLTLSGIPAFWQGIVAGGVLIIAVLLDHFRPKLQ